MSRQVFVRIVHYPSGTLLAAGPQGYGLMPFEGNFYIRRRHLLAGTYRHTYLPGLCPYKGLYLWLDLVLPGGQIEPGLAWRYILPNPLLPFIAFRVALPGNHPALRIEYTPAGGSR